jgi:hypothetical protein
MTTAAVLSVLGAVFGGGGIWLGIFARKKTKAEAETEAIKGSSLVVEMYERLASRYEARLTACETELISERVRCNALERAIRKHGITIE